MLSTLIPIATLSITLYFLILAGIHFNKTAQISTIPARIEFALAQSKKSKQPAAAPQLQRDKSEQNKQLYVILFLSIIGIIIILLYLTLRL